MKTIDIIDVTQIEPRLKHPAIFEKFDSLRAGEAFMIHNDHDPKPLYYQLLAERGQIFTWDNLESGPETWRIKIQKRLLEGGVTIGEMVKKDFRRAQVFKNMGIDFCCGGKKTLEEACEKKGIDVNLIKEQLLEVNQQVQSNELNYDEWETGFLIDYIVHTHHQFVKESLPFIKQLATKVAKVHGGRHPETIQIAKLVETISQVQSLHLMKEEKIIFPFIKELAQSKNQGIALIHSSFGPVSTATQMMEAEHEQTAEDMAAIRKLTNDYRLPADACTSYTVLYKKLEEFENDLFNHVHLENNILFPQALELEKELTA